MVVERIVLIERKIEKFFELINSVDTGISNRYNVQIIIASNPRVIL